MQVVRSIPIKGAISISQKTKGSLLALAWREIALLRTILFYRITDLYRDEAKKILRVEKPEILFRILLFLYPFCHLNMA